MSLLENVWTLIKIGNGLADGFFLLAFALVVLVLIAAGVAHTRQRIREARREAGEELAKTRDPVEDFIVQALRYEADQQMLRRGRRRDVRAGDIHDVFEDGDR